MGLSDSQGLATAMTTLLLLLPMAAMANDDVPPYLSPLLENVCNEVECGKGSCEAAPGYPFNFKCNCENGWKRSRLDDDKGIEFLPCIIPNCSLDYSCMPAPPPIPPVPYNTSFFDPCYWIYCGQGTCTKNNTYSHTCQCDSGHSNLLGVSAFPCYPDCAISSASCQRLGIRVAATSSNNPSSTTSFDNTNNKNNNNQAMTFSMGKLMWITILFISTTTIF